MSVRTVLAAILAIGTLLSGVAAIMIYIVPPAGTSPQPPTEQVSPDRDQETMGGDQTQPGAGGGSTTVEKPKEPVDTTPRPTTPKPTPPAPQFVRLSCLAGASGAAPRGSFHPEQENGPDLYVDDLAGGAGIVIRAAGIGLPMDDASDGAQREATALLAAQTVAKRALVQWLAGSDLASLTVVNECSLTRDTIVELLEGEVPPTRVIWKHYDAARGRARVWIETSCMGQ